MKALRDELSRRLDELERCAFDADVQCQAAEDTP
jgi:hypothetical protein